MSGIPVYTQSPISAAARPSGVTPQTAAPGPQRSSSGPNHAPATTTATSTYSNPSAQPGAAAPAPTAAAQRYSPLKPTPTMQTQPKDPPAPQPGAFPAPLSKSPLLPPPRAGETYQAPQQAAAPTQPAQSYPPQMSIPPLSGAIGAHPPASSTTTTKAPSSSYPVAIQSAELGGPRQSIEHPPGYQQNTYAVDLTPDQRRAYTGNLGNQNSSHSDNNTEQESVWDTAKNWAQQAGEKLQKAEAEVWKKINK